MECQHTTTELYNRNYDVCLDCYILIKKDYLHQDGEFIDYNKYVVTTNCNSSRNSLRQNLVKKIYNFPKTIINHAVYNYRSNLHHYEKWNRPRMAYYVAKAFHEHEGCEEKLTLNQVQKIMKVPITEIPKELTAPYKPEKSTMVFLNKELYCKPVYCWWCACKIYKNLVFISRQVCNNNRFVTGRVFCSSSCVKGFLETITSDKKWFYETQILRDNRINYPHIILIIREEDI